MHRSNSKEESLKNLIELSNKQGYVLSDDIIDYSIDNELPIQEVDSISRTLAQMGIIIRDTPPRSTGAVQSSQNVAEEVIDYSQTDYEAVFDRVIELDPGLAILINEAREYKPPQWREIQQLQFQAKEGNAYAIERIFEMHLRVAIKLAVKRAESFSQEIADTISEACIGLLFAIEKYNPDEHGSFQSYASMWILQRMNRETNNQRPLIYYPVHKKELFMPIYEYVKEHGCTTCEKIWNCENLEKHIRSKVNTDDNGVYDSICQCVPLLSLEAILEDEEGRSIYSDTLDDYEKGYEIVEHEFAGEQVRTILDSLTDRERDVIELRYGFRNGKALTLEEIGKHFNLTRERIRQIESKALRKLCRSKELRKMKNYF